MSNYITYWIPLTNFIDIEKKFSENELSIQKKNIKDYPDGDDNILEVKLLKNKNLEIYYLNNTYTLKYENSSDSGFVIYSHKINEYNVENLLDIQVYDLYKNFFHIHEAHNDEEDSLIKAFNHKKNYTIFDEAKCHYCNEYIKKFKRYIKIIDEYSPKVIWIKYQLSSDDFMVLDAIELIIDSQRRINKAQTELIYFKFLLSIDDINIKFFENEHKYFSEKFIIKHKEYEMLDDRFDIEYSEIINKHQSLLGKVGLYISVLGTVLGVVGIYYTLAGLTSKEFNNRTKKLEENINKECINYLYKKNSMDNFMLSIENKNFDSLELIKEKCIKK